MALKKCPKCGKWVSEYAPICERCGQPISSEMIRLAAEKQRHRIDVGMMLTNIGRFFWDARLLILAIIAFLMIVFWPLLMIFRAFIE